MTNITICRFNGEDNDCKDVVNCYASECPNFSCCKKAMPSAPEKHSDVYDWRGIKFIDKEHRELFERLVSECRVLHDPYRLALFYLRNCTNRLQ